MDFLPLDTQSFTLDLPDSHYSLYSPQSNSYLDYELDKIAKKACLTISSSTLTLIDHQCPGCSRRISIYSLSRTKNAFTLGIASGITCF